MSNLTEKELTAIGDQLAIEDNLIKKYDMYATQCEDMVLKQKCTDIANKHRCHFDTLLNHLN